MYQCPECLLKLRPRRSAHVNYWACTNCGGHLVGIYPLKRLVGDSPVQKLWMNSAEAPFGQRACPSCQKKLRVILHEDNKVPVELDLCRLCQVIWTDQGELVDTHQVKDTRKKLNLNKEQMAEYTEAVAELARQTTKPKEDSEFISDRGPDDPLKWLPAIVGLPVEMERRRLRDSALLTWILALTAVCIHIRALSFGLQEMILSYGFISAEPLRHMGVTFISSFFLHGGWFHLIGNLYFLLVFGDDIEDELGWSNFLVLIFASHLAGILGQTMFSGPSTIPMVGASAGVFGVLGYYMVRFPRAKVGYMYLFFFRAYWLRISAMWLLLGKIAWEMLMASVVYEQAGVRGGVAHAAHIGGAFIGVVIGLAMAKKRE